MGMNKVRVLVLCGGRSAEHSVSVVSAGAILRHLDRRRYNVSVVWIDQKGKWHTVSDLQPLLNTSLRELPRLTLGSQVVPVGKLPGLALIPLNGRRAPLGLPSSLSTAKGRRAPLGLPSSLSTAKGRCEIANSPTVDVVFPALHGPMGEDGTVQGLLELAGVPYVGCGVLASAAAMDKDVALRLARQARVPTLPYLAFYVWEWKKDPAGWKRRIRNSFGYPVFVKPSRLGSSVGISKVRSPLQLGQAIQEAFRYDDKLIVEKALNGAREIEVSVLGEERPLVSVPGEVVPRHEFYTYEAKYLDPEGAELLVPAKLTAAQTWNVQELARRIFVALDGSGMARVDFLMNPRSGALYFGEINTIPGFTSISMYPRLWEASGISYSDLLDRLIRIALNRHRRRKGLRIVP